MDVDELFESARARTETWRDRVEDEALNLCLAVEERIEKTQKRPSWTKMADRLGEMGVTVSPMTVGAYYRSRYPFLRRD